MCEIFPKLTITKPHERHWYRSGVFIAKFEKISHIVLVFPLYTLNMKMTAGAGKHMFNTEIYNYKQDEC